MNTDRNILLEKIQAILEYNHIHGLTTLSIEDFDELRNIMIYSPKASKKSPDEKICLRAGDIKTFSNSVAVVAYDEYDEPTMYGSIRNKEVIKIELTETVMKVYVKTH